MLYNHRHHDRYWYPSLQAHSDCMDKYFTLCSHQSARRGTQGDKKEEGHRGKGICFSRLHETSPRNDKEVLGVSNTVCTHSPQLNLVIVMGQRFLFQSNAIRWLWATWEGFQCERGRKRSRRWTRECLWCKRRVPSPRRQKLRHEQCPADTPQQ